MPGRVQALGRVQAQPRLLPAALPAAGAPPGHSGWLSPIRQLPRCHGSRFCPQLFGDFAGALNGVENDESRQHWVEDMELDKPDPRVRQLGLWGAL